MKHESLPLFSSFTQRKVLLIALLTVFSLNITYEFVSYKLLISEELVEVEGNIVNIYEKPDYDVIKVVTPTICFFTSVNKNEPLKKLDNISLVLITTQISFLDYLKGFYTKSFNITKLENSSLQMTLSNSISIQHQSTQLQELFNALFLAIPLNQELRSFFATLGVSHLIAISGFHLGILSLFIYTVVHFIYAPFHQNHFPYRNKKVDIVTVSLCLLFLYLLLTNVVASLLRAFVMLMIGIILLRSNIKIFSFETLLWTLLVILALFPFYVFSLSLWFSLTGVFLIYLYLNYFKNLPKLWYLLFFNFWIFFCFNPIVHFFFENTSWVQLLSPLITMVFTIFYPLELVLHFFSMGFLLDEVLQNLLVLELSLYFVATPLWFFVLYVSMAFISIWYRKAFIGLNMMALGFNIFLYW